MANAPTEPVTRLEAQAEGGAIVLSIYAPMLFTTVEFTARDGRRLAAELIHAAEYLEAHGHAEN